MSIYDTLNEQQKEGVFTTQGPVLILAGAGSGKTRVLTHRVAYLIDQEGVNPWNILAITFTNKAAGEMRERVDKLVGFGSESIWVSTFHSTCVRILRRYIDRLGFDTSFTIYDTDDQKSLMKDVCKRLNVDTKQYREKALLGAISSAKDEMVSPTEFRLRSMGDWRTDKIAQVYEEYQNALKKNNALDFDDLIVKTVELFQTCPDVLESYQERFKYIMVDEYQDTNTAQFELIRLLADKYRNLCVVGDDDQSIYKFRGANIRNILDFEQVYPEATVIKLEQNYRSTQIILDAANNVIANNRDRKEKSLWTRIKDGEKIHLRPFDTAYEEAEYIASDVAGKVRLGKVKYGDCAVLYRTNAQARLLEEQFIMEGIPYDVVGGTNFYARREIKDMLAYLKTIDNGRDDLAVKRIINIPKRGIGTTTINRVQDYADAQGISFFDALTQAQMIPGIGKGAAKLTPFVLMIQVFRAKAENYHLKELMADIIETTKYEDYLDEGDAEETNDRMENVQELLNKMVAYEETAEEPSLSGFLQEVALVADIDRVDDDGNRVLLMTLHSAKGLEFEQVYLAGMEDGLFPSYMSINSDSEADLQEERRLAYVGITRAKRDLTISFARSRMIHGETQYNPVSRFIREIPADLLDGELNAPRRFQSLGDSFEASLDRSFRDVSFSRDTDSDFSGDYGEGQNRPYYGQTRPKATLRPKKTAEENKPFIARGMASLNRPGISKGGGTFGKPDYEVGDRVRHIKYGDGTVRALEAGPRDYQVTVEFDSVGQKIMYAGFAKLTKI